MNAMLHILWYIYCIWMCVYLCVYYMSACIPCTIYQALNAECVFVCAFQFHHRYNLYPRLFSTFPAMHINSFGFGRGWLLFAFGIKIAKTVYKIRFNDFREVFLNWNEWKKQQQKKNLLKKRRKKKYEKWQRDEIVFLKTHLQRFNRNISACRLIPTKSKNVNPKQNAVNVKRKTNKEKDGKSYLQTTDYRLIRMHLLNLK